MQVSINIVIKGKSLPSVNNDYTDFEVHFGFSRKCFYEHHMYSEAKSILLMPF